MARASLYVTRRAPGWHREGPPTPYRDEGIRSSQKSRTQFICRYDVRGTVPIEVGDHDRGRETARGEAPRRLKGPTAKTEEDGDVAGSFVGGDQVQNPVPVQIGHGHRVGPAGTSADVKEGGRIEQQRRRWPQDDIADICSGGVHHGADSRRGTAQPFVANESGGRYPNGRGAGRDARQRKSSCAIGKAGRASETHHQHTGSLNRVPLLIHCAAYHRCGACPQRVTSAE